MSAYVERFPEEARLIRATLLSSFIALAIGGTFGLIQVLHRTGVLRFIDSTDYGGARRKPRRSRRG